MDQQRVDALKKLISESEKMVIIPHKNPDGDAIGSTLALWHYLGSLGKEAHVIVPNDFPKFLKWMPGTDAVLNFEWHTGVCERRIMEADVIFTLDFNHLGRIAPMDETVEKSPAAFVMIDHHEEPGDYAQITLSDATMSSTCEMVYDLIEMCGDLDKLTPEIGECLYTGIMTDTGSFKFTATTGRTHRIVADLIDRGIDKTAIHQRVFDTNSPNRLHLLGCALKNMVILPEFATAYMTLSQAELDQCDHQKGDTEGFVNYGLTLDGIQFAVIFIENREEGIIKISFRSIGDFSVNEFARTHFQGGGHQNAAGGRSERSLHETVAFFESLLPEYAPKTKA